MGYALFASRKIMLTSRINELQLELLQIANQKQRLLDFSAVIADGTVTTDEAINNIVQRENLDMWNSNLLTYTERYGDNIGESLANADADFRAQHSDLSEAELNAAAAEYQEYVLSNQIMPALGREYYNNVTTAELSAQENQLDMRQKQIESKLTAAQQELQSVEQAEGQAIQNATPKYAGLG